MSAPERAPGVAKVKTSAASGVERGDHFWKKPEPPERIPDWFNPKHPHYDKRRAEAELRLTDARHDLKKWPREEPGLTPRIMERQELVIWRSGLSDGRKQLLSLGARLVDHPTRLIFVQRRKMWEHAGVPERTGQLYLREFVDSGLILKPNEHRYTLHSDGLKPYTTSWDQGIWLLKWGPLGDDDLELRIARCLNKGSANDRRRSNTDRSWAIGESTIRSCTPSTSLKYGSSLSPDRSRPSSSLATSALVTRQGDLPAPAPPGDQAEPPSGPRESRAPTARESIGVPSAPRAVASNSTAETQTPPAGREAVESEECKVRTGVVDSGPTSTPQSGSTRGRATPVRILPETYRGLNAIVAAAQRATGGVAVEPRPLFGWLVDRCREGRSLGWCGAFVEGVLRGGGEAALARDQARSPGGVNPFRFATANPELYVHEGHKVQGADGPPTGVRAKLAAAWSPPVPPKAEEPRMSYAEWLAAQEPQS